jgi:hypothetical protein
MFGTRARGQRPPEHQARSALLSCFDGALQALDNDPSVEQVFATARIYLATMTMNAPNELAHQQRMALVNDAFDYGRRGSFGDIGENGDTIFVDDALDIAAALIAYLDKQACDAFDDERLLAALRGNWPDDGHSRGWILEHIPARFTAVHRQWAKLNAS